MERFVDLLAAKKNQGADAQLSAEPPLSKGRMCLCAIHIVDKAMMQCLGFPGPHAHVFWCRTLYNPWEGWRRGLAGTADGHAIIRGPAAIGHWAVAGSGQLTTMLG